MDIPFIQNLLYVVAAVLFIRGIMGLTHPRTAVNGNLKGLAGMLLAMAVAMLAFQGENNVWQGWYWILIGVIVGSLIGWVSAKKVQMTAMPEMVALFNGSGGLASMLVAGAVFHHLTHVASLLDTTQTATAEGISAMAQAAILDNGDPLQTYIATVASAIIGAVTFTGSVLAFLKLQGKFGNAITNPLLKFGNGTFLAIAVVCGTLLVVNPDWTWMFWAVAIAAMLCGVFFVMPIGGADMPVVLALLNSYSGLAACATGFVINNTVLIVAGALVGASGLPQQGRVAIQACRQIRVLRPQGGLSNRQGPLIQWLRLGIPTSVGVEQCEVIQDKRNVRVVWLQRLLMDCQGPFEEWLGLRVPALPPIDHSETVEVCSQGRVS